MLKKIWFFFRPWIGMVFRRGGTILQEAAMEAVARIERNSSEKPGQWKREQAARIIRDQLRSAGVEMGKQAVYAAIELAVGKRKGTL